jgi:hypothetical protein
LLWQLRLAMARAGFTRGLAVAANGLHQIYWPFNLTTLLLSGLSTTLPTVPYVFPSSIPRLPTSQITFGTPAQLTALSAHVHEKQPALVSAFVDELDLGTRVFATGSQTRRIPSSVQKRWIPSPPAPHCRSLTLAARGALGYTVNSEVWDKHVQCA